MMAISLIAFTCVNQATFDRIGYRKRILKNHQCQTDSSLVNANVLSFSRSAVQSRCSRLRGGIDGTDDFTDFQEYEDNFRFINTMVFVDRRVESKELCRYLLLNQQRILNEDGAPKPILVSAGQKLGSGKSTLGQFAIKALKMYPQVLKKVRYFNLTKHSLLFGERGLLDAYMSSCSVRVDLNKYNPSSLRTLSCFLAFALYCSIMQAVSPLDRKSTTMQHFQSLKLSDVTQVMNHFLLKYPNQTFFLHWDEVGCIELDTFTHIFGKSHGGILKFRMERYYYFWIDISPLLSLEGIYVFVTDNRPAFSLISHGSLRDMMSPTNHKHLVVGGLQPEDISETFQKSTTSDERPLTQFVRIDRELFNFFGKEVHACTGGLPRLIQEAFEALCNLQSEPLQLRSKAQIMDALEKVYELVQDSALLIQRRIDVELQELYLAFMMLAVFKISISNRAEVTLKFDHKISVLDAIEAMDILIDYPHIEDRRVKLTRRIVRKESLIQLRFPKWSLRRAREKGSIDDMRFALLSPLLPMTDVLDMGAPFEWILRVVLVFSLGWATCTAEQCTWADYFPVLQGSSFKQLVAEIDFEQPISFVPAVGPPSIESLKESTFKEALASPTTIWERKMHSRDWNVAIRILVQPHSFVLPGPQSASPDLMYCGASTDSVIAAWAVKQNCPENRICWANIQEEIDKASPLLLVKDVSLVITALHLGKEVENAIAATGSSSLHLSPGSWFINQKVLQLPQQTVTKNDKGRQEIKLKIPDRMDLLILGERDLTSLLGENNVHTLHDLVANRRQCIPSLFLSILRVPARVGKLPHSARKMPE